MNALLLAIFPLLFVLVWMLVVQIIALVGGWTLLARHYRFRGEITCPLRHWQSAKILWTNYNRCLSLGATPDGLLLVPPAILRPSHSTLLIPWSEIVAEPQKRLLSSGYRLKIARFRRGSIFLPGQVFAQLLAEVKQELC